MIFDRLKATDSPITAVCMWGGLIVLAILAVLGMQPPKPLPASAPLEQFSAERALRHVQMLARVPRPIGSSANDDARQYLMGQLSSSGLNPRIFSAIGIAHGGSVAGEVQDIIGRLPGTDPSHAVLLLAHYDSIACGSGAGDDAAGVAAILETVRALHGSPALRNDVIVLFTDGEEEGLLGAEAFANLHPWMKDTGLVLNFDARGNRGPSVLFETSSNNRMLVREVVTAVPRVLGSSIFNALYKTQPYATDFEMFRPSEIPGLNFGFGAGVEAYHSRLDTTGNLSLASVQDHGSYALGLTRHFGQMDLARLGRHSGDAVFFNLPGGYLVEYPESWVIPEEILATLWLAFTVWFATARRQLNIQRTLLALLVAAGLIVVITTGSALTWWVITLSLKNRLLVGDVPANSFLFVATILLGASAGSLFLKWCGRKFSVRELCLAGLTLLCGLSWLSATRLPSGSYVLLWPILLATTGAAVVELRNKSGGPPAYLLAAFAGTSAAVLLFAPLVYLGYILRALDLGLVIIAGGFLGVIFIMSPPRMLNSYWPAIVLLAATFTCLGVGVTLSHYSARHPRPDSMQYSLDAGKENGFWFTSDKSLDSWTQQFFPKALHERTPREAYGARAPSFPLPAPVVDIQADETDGDLRKLHLLIRSMRAADVLRLNFNRDVSVKSVEIEGREINLAGRGFSLTLYGMQKHGAGLHLTLQASSAIDLWLMDESAGLPSSVPPRPSDTMEWGKCDTTRVTQTYRIER